MNFTGGQKKLLTHQEVLHFFLLQSANQMLHKDLFRLKRTCSSKLPSPMYTNHYPFKNDRRQVISSVWNVKHFCDLLMFNRKKVLHRKKGKVQNKNNVGVLYPEKAEIW